MRTYFNLLTTMTLGGLWHGANWTFIVWGAYHGALLAVYRRLEGFLTKLLSHSRLAKLASIVLLFHLVCLGWLFFRAQTFSQASSMIVLMLTNFQVTAFSEFGFGMILFFVTPLIVFEIWLEWSGDLAAPLHRRAWVRAVGYGYAVLMMWFFSAEQAYEFIYFQF